MCAMPASSSDRGWCLVTGASRGIGEAIAATLIERGFRVIGWARSSPEGAEAFDPGNMSAPFLWQQVDVSDPQAVAGAFDELRGHKIGLAALVLNAGVGRWRGLAETPLSEWRSTLAVNLDGAFHVLTGALPLLDREAAPVVIGLLSDSALYSFPNRAAYSASKTGMRALLETARMELRGDGIRFTLLYPSRVDTYFAGSVESGRPGLRATGLSAQQVAEVVGFVLSQPPTVELREIHLSATAESFGPYHKRESA
jgi:NADP-dependent 3-hydroxy acid dehydrogenase YdfG